MPPNHRAVFVQQAIEIAMDHKPSHRELTSVLISDLYGYVLTETDIVKAFENLLADLNDLILDIPDGAIVLGISYTFNIRNFTSHSFLVS